MKALILVKRLYLRHVLARLPCAVPTFSLHEDLQAAIVQLSAVTNLLCPAPDSSGCQACPESPDVAEHPGPQP